MRLLVLLLLYIRNTKRDRNRHTMRDRLRKPERYERRERIKGAVRPDPKSKQEWQKGELHWPEDSSSETVGRVWLFTADWVEDGERRVCTGAATREWQLVIGFKVKALLFCGHPSPHWSDVQDRVKPHRQGALRLYDLPRIIINSTVALYRSINLCCYLHLVLIPERKSLIPTRLAFMMV